MATISTLADQIQNRIEETQGGAGAWWSRQLEVYSAANEAMNDMMVLVGRPTQIVSTPFTLVANQCFQTVPKGVLAITDIQGATGNLYKLNLYDFDYLQTYWGSGWTQDVGPRAKEWAPVGFNMFVVHPACSTPQTVNLTAIQYPITDTWPYTGNETIPFEDQFFQHLEEYGAYYARLKELGVEFQEGAKLFQTYLNGARRMSAIQDLRDPLIFASGFGSSNNVNPTTMR